MPERPSPVVGERVRVRIGLATVEGTVTDVYQTAGGLRVVVETIEDDSEEGRQVRTIAVPAEQVIRDDEQEQPLRTAPSASSQPRRGGAGRFVLRKGSTGKFHFNIMAGNGQLIATSEAYESKASALNGIRSVQTNAPAAEIVSSGPDDAADQRASETTHTRSDD